MIKEFEKLSFEEQEVLLKGPAVVSILAACGKSGINEWVKSDTIKLSHLKTFTAHPRLITYYKEVDKLFEKNFEAMAKKYHPVNEAKRVMIQKEVEILSRVISKLDNTFATILRMSLSAYADHVKKAYKGLVVNFLFPFPIPGLTE